MIRMAAFVAMRRRAVSLHQLKKMMYLYYAM